MHHSDTVRQLVVHVAVLYLLVALGFRLRPATTPPTPPRSRLADGTRRPEDEDPDTLLEQP